MNNNLTQSEEDAWWKIFSECQTCQKPKGRYWCDKCEQSKCGVCGDGDKFIHCPIHN